MGRQWVAQGEETPVGVTLPWELAGIAVTNSNRKVYFVFIAINFIMRYNED